MNFHFGQFEREGDKENAIIWYRKARESSNPLVWIKEIELWASMTPKTSDDLPGHGLKDMNEEGEREKKKTKTDSVMNSFSELAQRVLDEFLDLHPEMIEASHVKNIMGNIASMKGQSDLAIQLYT